MNELDRQVSAPNRLLGWFHGLASRLLFFQVNSVALAEAATIHEEALASQRRAYATAIEATRYAKGMATPGDDDERAILDVFVEGVLAGTKVMHRMMESGSPSDPEKRKEELERPTSGSIASPTPSVGLAGAIEPSQPDAPPTRPKRGRPLGSKTKTLRPTQAAE